MKFIDGDTFSFFSPNEINEINNFRRNQESKEISFMKKLNNRPFFDWMRMNNILIIPLVIKKKRWICDILTLIRNANSLELAVISLWDENDCCYLRDLFEIPRDSISKDLYRFDKLYIENIREILDKKINYFKKNKDKYFEFPQKNAIDVAEKNI